MFNPSAMMGGGGGTSGSGTGQTQQGGATQSGTSSGTRSFTFDPNIADISTTTVWRGNRFGRKTNYYLVGL